MVGVVHLGDEIGDRQLQAVDEETRGLIRRREAELRSEIGA